MHVERDARALLNRFAAATGLEGDAQPRRYLWTDAFAVCTWVGLGEVERAMALVDAVHWTLGRHRDDDPREGWLSGLSEEEGARRPTAGGLRIGKPLPERGPDQPHRSRLEWDRDGQYFHYLTRWIRALVRLADATGDERYVEWATELGRVAWERFSHGTGAEPSLLYWKMSIDLSRPLVESMGQHDPLDGYVVLSEVAARGGTGLDPVLRSLAGMGQGADWSTGDPLGAGSLMTGALVLSRLPGDDPGRRQILSRVLNAAARSIPRVDVPGALGQPLTGRLPFRELGLAIGLAAITRLPDEIEATVDPDALAALRAAGPEWRSVVGFWRDTAHQRGPNWFDHDAINTVMLAAALAPEGYLGD